MPVELVKISSTQLEGLSKQRTVFFFSVGPVEDHGPHLPMGLDLEEAYQLCLLAAQDLETHWPNWAGVIMPPAPLGIDSTTTKIAITVRPHVLRDWLVDACRSLSLSGFCHFVCFTGHLGPRQLTAIEEASRIIQRDGRRRKWGHALFGVNHPMPCLIPASSALVTGKDTLNSPFWPDPEEHGGKRDTSVALAISKESVDPSYKELPTLLKNPSRWGRNFSRKSRRLSGYWGEPSAASEELGQLEIRSSMEKVFVKMQ